MEINELKNQFLNYLVAYRGRTENTKKAYDFDLTKFLKLLASKGVSNVESITTKLIEDYLFHLGSSTTAKARVRSSIKSFFNFLSRKEYITGSNPAMNLESMKLPEKSPEYLSQEQRTIFLNTVERESTPYYRERDLLLVKLLLRTGLRRAEIIGLNISDIDFSKRSLRVKRKGNREAYLTLHRQLIEDLKKYLKIINRNADDPLFMSKKGKRLSASSVWHLVKTYSHKAGFNGSVTVHSLRHTFASTLLDQGMPLPYIQALMGHKSSQTTARYLHFQNSELNEAFNRVIFEA
jgi:site-specific recombinase XerD